MEALDRRPTSLLYTTTNMYRLIGAVRTQATVGLGLASIGCGIAYFGECTKDALIYAAEVMKNCVDGNVNKVARLIVVGGVCFVIIYLASNLGVQAGRLRERKLKRRVARLQRQLSQHQQRLAAQEAANNTTAAAHHEALCLLQFQQTAEQRVAAVELAALKQRLSEHKRRLDELEAAAADRGMVTVLQQYLSVERRMSALERDALKQRVAQLETVISTAAVEYEALKQRLAQHHTIAAAELQRFSQLETALHTTAAERDALLERVAQLEAARVTAAADREASELLADQLDAAATDNGEVTRLVTLPRREDVVDIATQLAPKEE
jgi:hypothetical protein